MREESAREPSPLLVALRRGKKPTISCQPQNQASGNILNLTHASLDMDVDRW